MLRAPGRFPFRAAGVALLVLGAAACGGKSAIAPTPATGTPPSATAPPTATPLPVGELGDALRPGRAADLRFAQDLQYHIRAQVDPAAASVSGSEDVRWVNRTGAPRDALVFRLYANLPYNGADMQVTAARVGGRAVTPLLSPSRTVLRVPLDPPLADGGTAEVALDFRLHLPATSSEGYNLFHADPHLVTLVSWYPQVAPYRAGGWFTDDAPPDGDQVFSQAGGYLVELRVPRGFRVWGSGAPLPGDGSTLRYAAAPVRDFFAIVADSYQEVSRTTGDGVRITVATSPELRAAAEQALDLAADIMTYFERRFGPYPYRRLVIVEGPVTAGGVEWPMAVELPGGVFTRGGPSLGFTLAHELAHQWWYGVVGDNQVDEPWLDEPFANYSALRWYEDRHPDAFAALEGAIVLNPYRGIEGTAADLPINLPVAAYPTEKEYARVVYGKGAYFLQQLEQQVGATVFERALQTYYRAEMYRVTSGAAFRSAVQSACGCDLSGLFDRFLAPPPATIGTPPAAR